MPRTCSYALLGATAVLALTALNGCTIYTYSAPPRRVSSAPPPPPAALPPGRTPIFTNRNAANPTPAATGVATRNGAPRITAPIAFGNGTSGSFQGLAYVIPEATKTVPALDQLVPFATLFTDSFDVAPQPFTAGFPGALKQTEWFAIRYDGLFNVSADGVCTFDLLSADGAILYVDGQQVVSNDGIHSSTRATGKATLRAGSHQLRLDYFKGPQGTVALRVNMAVGTNPSSLLVGALPR